MACLPPRQGRGAKTTLLCTGRPFRQWLQAGGGRADNARTCHMRLSHNLDQGRKAHSTRCRRRSRSDPSASRAGVAHHPGHERGLPVRVPFPVECLPIPSSATSAGMTRHIQSRDGSTGSTQLPTGWVRGVPRPSSSIRPTTSTRSSWHADSTTMCEPGCPRSSRSQSRSPPDRRLSSEPGPGTAVGSLP
jgi:hypothetical protein